MIRGATTGWDAKKDKDSLEALESNGVLFFETADSGECILPSRMVNGISIMRGLDAFQIANPTLQWAVAQAPSGLEFIVPDTWGGSVFGGRPHHQAAIPIAPDVVILAANIFPFPSQLSPAQVAFINAYALNLSQEFYFARNLEVAATLRPFQANWYVTPQITQLYGK